VNTFIQASTCELGRTHISAHMNCTENLMLSKIKSNCQTRVIHSGGWLTLLTHERYAHEECLRETISFEAACNLYLCCSAIGAIDTTWLLFKNAMQNVHTYITRKRDLSKASLVQYSSASLVYVYCIYISVCLYVIYACICIYKEHSNKISSHGVQKSNWEPVALSYTEQYLARLKYNGPVVASQVRV